MARTVKARRRSCAYSGVCGWLTSVAAAPQLNALDQPTQPMSCNAALTTCIDQALVGGDWAARWLSPSSLAIFKYTTAIFPSLPNNFSARFTLIVYGLLTPALTVSQFSSTMEMIGAVASTAAIVELAAKIASLCLKYSTPSRALGPTSSAYNNVSPA